MIRTLLAVLLLAVATPVSAQTCGGPGVALQVLGSGGPELAPRRAASSHLLWIDDRAHLLIDTGGGSALRFGESGARVADLDAILLTSLHAGHTADLPALVQAAKLAGRSRPLPVYGPPGGRASPSTVMFVRDLFDGTRGAYRHLGEVLAPLARTGFKLDPHDLRERPPRLGTARPKSAPPVVLMANERVRVSALSLNSEAAPTVAYRIEAGGKVIAVLVDGSRADGALTALLADADLLLAGHAIPENAAEAAHGPRLPPSLTATIAGAARAKQLVLAHRSPATLGREDESLAVIRRHYAGTVHFADDLGCYRP